MYCYLDGTPHWSRNDGVYGDDDDDGDDGDGKEYVHVDADGDGGGVNNLYANAYSFFYNEDGNSTGMCFTI